MSIFMWEGGGGGGIIKKLTKGEWAHKPSNDTHFQGGFTPSIFWSCFLEILHEG